MQTHAYDVEMHVSGMSNFGTFLANLLGHPSSLPSDGVHAEGSGILNIICNLKTRKGDPCKVLPRTTI